MNSVMRTSLLAGMVWLMSGCAEWCVREPEQSVHHVAVIWLKPHGNAEVRQRYQQASKPLADLPGVLEYTLGNQLTVPRSRPNAAVDTSFDLVVHGRFVSQSAYQAFLANPEYLRIAQTELKPLVERYQVYEFSGE